MMLATSPPLAATLPSAASYAPPRVVPGALRRVTSVIGDLLGLMGIVLCVPFVILAIGIPIALCIRFLLWIVGML